MYNHVSYASIAALLSWQAAAAGSLKDIDHVVLFMQENRAFDHYFGTMAGVRGFADPNVHYNNGRSVFHQDVNSTLTNKTDTLLPFYLNYLGGNCNHGALNADRNNKWALANTPWSWGYFKRADLPVHFAIAEGWTVGDMYQESVIASTNPNRVTWISGSINAPGSPQAPSEGGIVIDNNARNSWMRGAESELLSYHMEDRGQRFKAVRGQLTEGRFLVFEKNGFALTSSTSGSSSVTATRASPIHDIVAQRWILHQLKQGGTQFTLESVSTSNCAADLGHMESYSQSAPVTINDLGNGMGHSVQVSSGQYLSINKNGKVVLTSKVEGFQLFSVTYS